MRARTRDQVGRGFLTPDPLVSPVGAGWSSNVYAFAGFDPVSLVDPWGLLPVSRADFAVYAKEHPSSTLKGWANEHADTIAAVAIGVGMVVGAVALIATGPVGLIVAGAVSGAALSGGLSILTNKNDDGTVEWGKVGKDTLIGGAAGGLGGAAVSAVSKVGAAMNATRAASAAAKAERFGTKATTLAQKATQASRFNPMRYVNSWRAGNAGEKAAVLGARAERFSQTAAHYKDVGGFARSLPGQTVQSVTSNVVSNNLTYAAGDFKEHTFGGYAWATASAVGVGVVSPRITPLRQKVVDIAPDAGLMEKGLTSVTGFTMDRIADFGVGMTNYAVAPQDKKLNWEDAFKDGFKGAASGGSGVASTGYADGVRVATARPGGE
ncbi:hypothetical protein IDM48_07325 [Rothia amarae]|uniref:RHS repeat-associated core domain-containing protein n=1 Tax=Rothia amarae TaxID=169480 RepID=A0A7H2BHS7_9MICC|nr:hypothetical protein [Rothia amarae]QNV39223.1 hypothetical protein IDM48_07325 [Rothia amarae]